MSENLRDKIEALGRYSPWGTWDGATMKEFPDGGWIAREEVLALLPAEAPPPAVCPACKRKEAVNKSQNATTFCVDPWHE